MSRSSLYLYAGLWALTAAACNSSSEQPTQANANAASGHPATAGVAAIEPGPAAGAPAQSPVAKPTPAADGGGPGVGTEADGGSDSDAGSDPPDAALPDAGPAIEPLFAALAITGAPLTAREHVWTYLEFPDTRCRDGSAAGISLRLNSASQKQLIYLEGGVYCFDEATCALNPANVADTLFNSAKVEPGTGIFDTRNARNPVRDWNVVYVPYCSGDAMAGTQTTPTDVPHGPAAQWFSGRLNMQAFLQRVVPTFPQLTDVLLVGMSAGGSSTLTSAVLVQRAFSKHKLRYVNDSGLPPAPDPVLPSCMQHKLRTLWGLEQSVLAECGASCPNQDDYWRDYAVFIAKSFADRPAGFIDAIEDQMMRMVTGANQRDCTGNLLLDALPAAPYRAALLDYRERVAAYPSHGTFFPAGTQHTWLKDNSFYSGKAGDMSLVDWFGKIASGQAAGHAGP